MKEKNSELLKQAWKEAPPPSVLPGEWETIWSRLVGSPNRLPVSRSPRRWLQAAAFAVVFLAGVGFGLWGGWLVRPAVGPSSSSVEQPTILEGGSQIPGKGTATLAALSSTSIPEGIDIEMLGLRDVRMEAVEEPGQEGRRYRMTAFTPRGIKIVWNYPADEPETHSLNGGQS